MDTLGPKDIEFTLHGLSEDEHGRVPARVFANKLKQLVSALEAADSLANGKVIHDYVLRSMHCSQPTAVLREITATEDVAETGSALPVFNRAIEAVKTHDANFESLSPVVKYINLLTSGVEKSFSFAEIKTSGEKVVRIDSFLRERSERIREKAPDVWFSGAVFGTFDGTLKFVDLRGALPQIKLILSAGGKEIDCICHQEDIETLKGVLSQRVQIYGRAIYAGNNPLPIRVEVISFTPLKSDADFTRWKGSFHPFQIESWDGEE